MSQTVDGVITNYVLDQAAPLTQVLSDGTNTYLYGNDRIAQSNSSVPEYFLTDGLGSVRQLVNSTGEITLTQSYAPYGEILTSTGAGFSAYAFTGEMADPSGLLYLRARYYEPTDGRFISMDTWAGDYTRPLSLHRWNYTEGNPINYIDPSGFIKCLNSNDPECIAAAQDLLQRARMLKNNVRDGQTQPVEAFAQLVDYAKERFTHTQGMMWGLTNVLIGVDPNSTAVWKLGLKEKYEIQPGNNPYFVGQNWLPYREQGEFAPGDWNSKYWDGTPNQAYHYWFSAATSYYDGVSFAHAANIVHDPYFLEWLCGNDLTNLEGLVILGNGRDVISYMTDTSKEDYLLSKEGMRFGKAARAWDGHFFGLHPGDWIRHDLSSN